MDRSFTPEIAVGSFQVPAASLAAAVAFSALWATAQAADARLPGMTSGQFIIIFGAEGGNVRWRNDTDLSVPITNSTGLRIIQDTELIYTANSLAGLQFIADGAQTPVLNVQIFKQRV